MKSTQSSGLTNTLASKKIGWAATSPCLPWTGRSTSGRQLWTPSACPAATTSSTLGSTTGPGPGAGWPAGGRTRPMDLSSLSRERLTCPLWREIIASLVCELHSAARPTQTQTLFWTGVSCVRAGRLGRTPAPETVGPRWCARHSPAGGRWSASSPGGSGAHQIFQGSTPEYRTLETSSTTINPFFAHCYIHT